MEATFWAHAHGAAVHFPLAATAIAALADGWALRTNHPRTTELRAVAKWTLLVAALGGLAAAISGLLLTRGSLLGHGAMRSHHLLAWPGLVLLVMLAVFRWSLDPAAARPVRIACVVLTAADLALLLGAGFFGGQLILAG